MELKDTIELMLSEDFRYRFKAEYYQLKIRRDKLQALLESYHSLDFEPNSDFRTLWVQLTAMNQYIEQLLKRAELEEISL